MGIYAERMAALTIKAVSPDACVRAILRQGNALELEFRPGSFRKYTEDSLGYQLSELTDMLAQAKTKAEYQAASEALGYQAEARASYNLNHRERRYRALLADIEVRGRSAGNCVKISSQALSTWQVRVKPGTLLRLDEETMCGEIASAYRNVHTDHRRQAVAARIEVYGPRA